MVADELGSRGSATQAVIDGLHDAGVNFVATFASSSLAELQRQIARDPRFSVIFASSESEAVGICAGAWLAGKKPALVMENSGLPIAAYALLRVNSAYGIPLLIILDYRGDYGDGNWWAIPFGWATDGILKGLRIPYVIVETVDQFKDVVPKMWKTSVHSKYASAIILRYRMLI